MTRVYLPQIVYSPSDGGAVAPLLDQRGKFVTVYRDAALTQVETSLQTASGTPLSDGRALVDASSRTPRLQVVGGDEVPTVLYAKPDGSTIGTPIFSNAEEALARLQTEIETFNTTASAQFVPRGREVVFAGDHGVVADGATDATAGLNAAIAALPAAGGTVLLPIGVVQVAGTIATGSREQVHFRGAGIGATTIRTSNPTAPVFDLGDGTSNLSFFTIRDLEIVTSVTRTGGAFIRARRCIDLQLERLRLDGPFYGIDMLDCQLARVIDVHIVNTRPGGECVRVDSTGTGSNLYLTRVATDAPAGAQPRAGLRVARFDGLFLTDTQFNHSGYGVILEPPAGQVLDHVYAVNCSFDTNQFDGLLMNAGGGQVRRAWFLGCWFGSNEGRGAALFGEAQGVSFIQPKIVNNGEHGLVLGDCSDTEVIAPQISGNSRKNSAIFDGILVQAASHRLKVIGGDIRPITGFPNTQQRAITIAPGASDYITVRDTNCDGNAAGVGISNGSTGTRNRFFNIRGYETQSRGTVVQGSAAGAVGVTHGLSKTPGLADIKVTPCSDLGAVTKWYIGNVTSSGFDIITAGAPGVAVTWSWSVDAS